MEELNKRKRELEQRLRHLPTDSFKAKLLENVKVGGKRNKNLIEKNVRMYFLLSFTRCFSIHFTT